LASSAAKVTGPTVGAGVAWQPDFLQGFGLPVSPFVGYQRTWWQDANFNKPASSRSFNYNFQRQDDIVKSGFTVALGALPSPVQPIITK
jgi:hypothetical protein